MTTSASTIGAEFQERLAKAESLTKSHPDQARALIESIAKEAEAAGDRRSLAAALTLFGALPRPGRYDAVVEQLRQALSIWRDIHDIPGQISVLNRLGNVAINVSDFVSALDYLHEAEKLAIALGSRDLQRDAVAHLGHALGEMGDIEGSLDASRRAFELSTTEDSALNRLLALNGLGCSLTEAGQCDAALDYLMRAHALRDGIPEEHERIRITALSCADIAKAYLKSGNPGKALEFAEEGSAHARRVASRAGLTNTLHMAGMAKLALGRPQEAVRDFEEALGYTNDMGFVQHGVTLRLALADALAACGSFEQAFQAHRAAYQTAQSINKDAAARRIEFQRSQAAIERATREREGAERLLFSMLPREIARELADKGQVKPVRHELASILFTDFTGFTQAASAMPADRMVAELTDIFSAFDDVADRCGIEKIKTIGDAYMAVAGVPTPCDDHATRLVTAALQMQAFMTERNARRPFKWGLRVGIHSGPVVAGVLGTRKPAFDVWGDTVNIAARMESSGEPGRINISAFTYELVQETFACTYRGKVDAKGKGEIDMYFVDGRVAEG